MLCQKCHKNLATVRYAEVVDGKVADLHLCHECMDHHRQEAETGFGLAGAVPSPKRTLLMATKEAVQQTCEACGMSFVEILDTGEVGCGSCYQLLAEHEKLFSEIHGNVVHRGKTPRINDARTRARGELQTKRALLRSSLEHEHYEEAAILRDEIRGLEAELSSCERGEH